MLEDEDGKEAVITYLNPGDFFGEIGLFEHGEARSACVRAKSACEVAEIPYDLFNTYSKAHPEICYTIGKQMAHRLRSTTKRIADLSFLDVTGRVAAILLDLSREMASRVLKELQDQGLIEAQGKTITIYGAR